MNFFVLVLLSLNILSVFGLPSESEDCIGLKNFFSKYPSYNFPECCSSPNTCDNNGNITSLEIRTSVLTNVDFSQFPILPKLKQLVIEGRLYKDGIFPTLFFKMPNLKILHITESNVKSFEGIPESCSLELLSFYHGELSGFPNEIFNCSNLKTLNLSKNNINSVPENINNLKNLQELFLIESHLGDLPDSIYDLSLKKLYLNKNSSLKAKLYKFKNPIDECSLGSTNLSCYEPGTCVKIVEDPEISPQKIIDEEIFKSCETPRSTDSSSSTKSRDSSSTKSRDSSLTKNRDSTSKKGDDSKEPATSSVFFICIGAIIIIVIIGVLLSFILKKNKKNDEPNNEATDIKPQMNIILNVDSSYEITGNPNSSPVNN